MNKETKLTTRLNDFPKVKQALIKGGYSLNGRQVIVRGADAERLALCALYDLTGSKRDISIHITGRNSKLSSIPSIAFSPWLTCNCEKCYKSGACYGLRFHYLSIFKFLDMVENTYLLMNKEDDFKKQLKAYFALNKQVTYFRWFENGDFCGAKSVRLIAEIASENPEISFLCMTKKFSLVNDYLNATKGNYPSNLKLRFSKFAYSGLNEIENPYNIPLTDCVATKEEKTRGAVLCPGTKTGCGACLLCWKTNREIDFLKH